MIATESVLVEEGRMENNGLEDWIRLLRATVEEMEILRNLGPEQRRIRTCGA